MTAQSDPKNMPTVRPPSSESRIKIFSVSRDHEGWRSRITPEHGKDEDKAKR
jgi:hypothetical protein